MEEPRWHKQVTSAARKYAKGFGEQEKKDFCQDAYLALFLSEKRVEETLTREGQAAAEKLVAVIARNAIVNSVRSERARKQVSLSDAAVFAEAEHQSNRPPAVDKITLRSAFSGMLYTEEYMMRRLFGIGCEQMTEAELAGELGKSRDAVHRLKVVLIQKMRDNLSKR